MPENLFKINAKEYILPGTRACQGCGLSLAYRYALKALRENTIVTLPACCLCVLHGIYPSTPVLIPALNNSFASTAASASGLVAGLQALNRTDITVMAIAGDGGTFDMGIQALSGAAERGTDFIYVCYDNEGYMNTGTQRSSATPLGALTTTTPIATKQQHKKDFLKIMEAHDIAYLATASPSYPIDLYDKFVKAKKIKGTRYIHLYIPCPPGWVYPPKDTVKMGRLAVETGIAPLFEIENGRFRFTGRSKSIAERGNRLPVINYLEKQGRFKKMNIEQLHQVQHWVDGKWQEYQRRSQE
ncbi:MAG: thiamine pyrophosphate-dependent enzyme [Syntrophales bacterium]|jgi:pyruvate ferredoxin oxidoreductase beta subunit|nr:thiamine pyrophosphate-dependent enzyme [Syntrophales bacterium]MCK9391895.1 thiamine pyrophosphate-dependent enzyme [Syntrophales bacterium]